MNYEVVSLQKNWAATALEDVCSIHDSKRIPINAKERNKRIEGKQSDELYPYYGATGEVGKIDGYLFNGQYLLLGEDGAPFLDHSKDTAYLVSGKFWVNNHAHILQAYISNEYLCHYLNQYDFSQSVTGTTRLKLNQSSLKEISVLFAPENEQHRIVAKIEELFSELDKGIESLKTAREQLKIYRQALLKHAFEGKLTEQWRKENVDKLESADQLLDRIQLERTAYLNDKQKGGDREAKRFLSKIKKNAIDCPDKNLPLSARWVNLLELCTLIVDCHNKTAPYQKTGIPLIRTPCIRNGKININHEARYISHETYKFWSRRCPPESGDVIFTREAPMGEAGIVPDGLKLCMGQRMMLIRPPQQIDEKYILYALMEPQFHSRMTKGSVGTGVKHLRVGDVERLCIALFPLEEQREIVSTLESTISVLDEQDSEIGINLKRCEALRQSILKKAFSGQLVPQDPNDEPASILLERIAAEKAELAVKAKTTKTTAKKVKSRLKSKQVRTNA